MLVATLKETKLSQLCSLIAPGYSTNSRQTAPFLDLDTEENDDVISNNDYFDY